MPDRVRDRASDPASDLTSDPARTGSPGVSPPAGRSEAAQGYAGATGGNATEPPPEFRRILRSRLTRRPTADGVVYVLDLRHRTFAAAGLDRLTLRDPAAADWPARGRTTSDEVEATAWIERRYAGWIFALLGTRRPADAACLTVRQAAQVYVDGLAAAYAAARDSAASAPRDGRHASSARTAIASVGPPAAPNAADVPPGKRSRVSLIRRHIVPKLGDRLLTALTRSDVEGVANGLLVRKPAGGGTRRSATGADGTKRNLLAALAAIWRATFGDTPSPFAGARVAKPLVVPAVSAEVHAFDQELPLGDERKGALDAGDLLRLLVAAMHLDREATARPNTRAQMVPNTAHAIAVEAGLGLRVSELCNLRHGHIHSAGYAVVHNAKVQQVGVERRADPTPLSLGPWIAELRAAEGASLHPNAFLIRTDPHAGPFRPAAPTTIARRIADAHRIAGIKVDGKATHGLRATFASHADANPHLGTKTLSRYLGHHRVYGTSTDDYVRQLVRLIRPEHRHIIELPHPDVVRAALDAFEPAARLVRRRSPWPRSREAQEARRARPARRPLGTSLLLPGPEGAAQ